MGKLLDHSVLLLLVGALSPWALAHAQNQPEIAATCNDIAPVPICLGESVTCTISPQTDTDTYLFEGKAGQEVSFSLRSLTNGIDPVLEIYDPTLTFFSSVSCGAAYYETCSTYQKKTLPLDGMYTILVADSGPDEGGTYQFQIDPWLPTLPPPGLAMNISASETVNNSVDVDFFQFQGVAGAKIRLAVATSTNGLDPWIDIIDPTLGLLANPNCGAAYYQTCTFQVDYTLAVTGTYYLRIRDSGTDEGGAYTVQINCLLGACPCSPKGLTADKVALTAAQGGKQTLSLDACPSSNAGVTFAGLPYVVLGSIDGYCPGQLFNGLVLPLNNDPYFLFTLANLNHGLYEGTFGLLDSNGKASAMLNVPGGLTLPAGGLVLYHAFAVLDATLCQVLFTSNPVELKIQ